MLQSTHNPYWLEPNRLARSLNFPPTLTRERYQSLSSTCTASSKWSYVHHTDFPSIDYRLRSCLPKPGYFLGIFYRSPHLFERRAEESIKPLIVQGPAFSKLSFSLILTCAHFLLFLVVFSCAFNTVMGCWGSKLRSWLGWRKVGNVFSHIGFSQTTAFLWV